ncbi:unnamed protein product [Dovyalis caffra]|uniref:Uncharacterized protein n=1 Tax=Dovyalis caffra TaxID=77055 RepID=A0AAV1RNA6_9ROSI|nr:unnamed protein product [Dovyalis caffra]
MGVGRGGLVAVKGRGETMVRDYRRWLWSIVERQLLEWVKLGEGLYSARVTLWLRRAMIALFGGLELLVMEELNWVKMAWEVANEEAPWEEDDESKGV